MCVAKENNCNNFVIAKHQKHPNTPIVKKFKKLFWDYQ